MAVPRTIAPLAVAALLVLAGCDRRSAPPPAQRSADPVQAAPVASGADRAPADVEPDAGYALYELPGRRRLEGRHEDWLETEVSPGSIAKLATLAEALRRGVIDTGTRITCTRRLTLADGRRADCSHAPAAAPLGVVDAIAQSCNVFAATVARRLTRAQLSAGLVSLGLAPPGPGDDPVAAAIGLGPARVRPSRLIDVLVRALDGPPALREGLAAAADRGTASALARAGLTGFAKTGTSRLPSGASLGLAVAAAPRPRPTHLVVALAPGGSGADAAGVAAHLLAGLPVRLGTPRAGGGYDVDAVPLDEYVARVVAGESGADLPVAARRALAITARTFLLANRGRHRDDGFDVCTLTHCQVARGADGGALAAAQSTSGRVLLRGQTVVPVFYSAACGGRIEAASAVAGDVASIRDLPWTLARPDPAGEDEPEWRTNLGAADLAAALQRAGFRGRELRDLGVDTAGDRVRRVRVAGFEPSTIAIDDFRRLVGHALGWNVVRSTRFGVRRTPTGYELRGRGHGHGVGLCVFGAGRLASAGRDEEAILAAYFPGLSISTIEVPGRGGRGAAVRLTLPSASESNRRWLQSLVERHLASVSDELGVPPPASLHVVVHPTVGSYQRATGRPWWTAAVARADAGRWTIHTIPAASLQAGGRLETTIRHELVHVVIDDRLRSRPLWVREGLALRIAGEALPPLEGPCPADDEFHRAATREAMSVVYRRAASCVAAAMADGAAWTSLGRR